MFAATTSEDFLCSAVAAATTTTNISENKNKLLQIIVIPSPRTVTVPEQLKVENIHSIGSVGWCCCELPSSSSSSSFIDENSLKKILQESKTKFETIAGKKAAVGDDEQWLERSVEIVVLSSEVSEMEHHHHLLESVLSNFQQIQESGASSPTVLLLYLSDDELKDVKKSSSSNKNTSTTSPSVSPFTMLISSFLTPSHGMSSSREEFFEKKMKLFPYAVLQPKMHRRIPLVMMNNNGDVDEDFAFRHSITLNQVVMEALQKGGLLGKYGA